MTIKNVTIIGAGTMGSGIAIALAQKGCGVQIVDISMDAIDRAQVFYARQVEKGRMDEQLADTAHALLSGSTDFEISANADLVIEAVFEDLDLKRETFDKLNDIVREDAFLATNTSCLKVGDIAEAVDNPDRFLALKFSRTPCALMDNLGGAEVERLIQPICQRHELELPKSLSNVGKLCS